MSNETNVDANNIVDMSLEATTGTKAQDATVPTPIAETTAEPIEAIVDDSVLVGDFQEYVNNFEQTDAIMCSVPAGDKTPLTMYAPSLSEEDTEKYLSGLPAVDYKTEAMGKWAEALNMSERMMYSGGFMLKTARRKDAKWRQAITSDRGNLGIAIPRWGETADAVTGTKAMLRVRALLGKGSLITVPLWHSGFHVTIQSPTEASLLEMYRHLSEDKIELGRKTWGMAFSNEGVIYTKTLVDFIINNIYETTLNAEDASNIRDHISSLDIPMLVWGLACVVFVNGFKYRRSILDKDFNTTETVDEIFNVRKMMVTDNTRLTPWQISHMANRSAGKMPSASIKTYRDQFTVGKGKEYQLNDQVRITINSPNVTQYITSGVRWVNNVVKMVEESFTALPNTTERNAHIHAYSKTSGMRQYAHMVESIVAGDMVFKDTETIENLLDELSSDNLLRESFFTQIKDYVENSAVSIIAIPAIPGKNISLESNRFPNLLPIDPLSTFFILLVGKCTEIVNRPF